MSSYSQGRSVEYAVMHDLTEAGFDCTRAASSKGTADVIAIGDDALLLVNVKRTSPPGPAERKALLAVAARMPLFAFPIVALGPVSRVTYRLLTGHGPADWVPWSPTEPEQEPRQETRS